MSLPDVVYPIREGRRPQPDHLRWSLRTLRHVPHRDVVIVGALPSWVDPDTVRHIPTRQDAGKFVNIGRNLTAALDHPDLTDDVVWMNDDFYVLADQPDGIPLISRGPMGDFCQKLRIHRHSAHHTDHVAYIKGMQSQRALLHQWGYDDTLPFCDLHVPIPINRDRCRQVLERAIATNPDHPLGHFRGLYGAGMATTHMRDVKVGNVRAELGDSPFFSTYSRVWKRGVAGTQLRDLYPDPSPYERTNP